MIEVVGQVDKLLRKFVGFCRKFLDDGAGGPWSIEGRDYVVREIWRPLLGYRVVAPAHTEAEDLCEACRKMLGEIVLEEAVFRVEHEADCAGATTTPIVVVGVNLPRRGGKTHSILSFATASIFLQANKRWSYMASAEDQADALLEVKVLRSLRRHASIAHLWKHTGNVIEVPGRNSWLEILPHSAGSAVGRGSTGVLVDESRSVHAEVAAALMPMIEDCHGLECPKGHGTWSDPTASSGLPPAPRTCPKCASPTVRWWGRVLFCSSSGMIEDRPDKDWFGDWIEQRIKVPHPNVHIFATDKQINPSVSPVLHGAIAGAFADVAAIADYVAVESSNKRMRRGEVYVKPQEIEAVVDRKLVDEPRGARASVGFLDTSRTGDITSLAMLEDDSQPGEAQLHRLVVRHVRIWDPKNRTDCPTGSVNDKDVEAYLEAVLPNFPRLQKFRVDTRIMPWAKALVRSLIAKGFRRVEDTEGWGEMENSSMYLELMELIAQRRIRIPDNAQLRGELQGLRKVDLPRGGIKVVDAGGDARGRNRRVGGYHRDLIMAIAGGALLASEVRFEAPSELSQVSSLQQVVDKAMPLSPIAELLRGNRNF